MIRCGDWELACSSEQIARNYGSKLTVADAEKIKREVTLVSAVSPVVVDAGAGDRRGG